VQKMWSDRGAIVLDIRKLVLKKALSYDEMKGRYLNWKNGLISKDEFVEQISHLLERSLEP